MTDRVIWGTKKVRAEDLQIGDAIRNRWGKWDVIEVCHFDDDDQEQYVRVTTEVGRDLQLRRVHLVDVQFAKPS